MDFVEIFNIVLDLSAIFFFFILGGVELPWHTVVTLSCSAKTCFLSQLENEIVLFYFVERV